MLKVVLFLLGSAALVALAWFLAGIPGHVAASFGSLSIETSAPVAIVMVVVLIVAILIVLRLLRAVWGTPRSIGNWRRSRRRAVGERAVTRVLVALAAGEQAAARKEAKRARLMLGDSPQTLLLAAEAGRLAGREDEAEEAFRALSRQRDAQFLGLRGLLRQAMDRRDWTEALTIAKQAEAAHPGVAWLRQQRAELALQTENWAEALQLVGSDPRRTTYYIAAADADPDPIRALSFGKQAWKHDPAFPPAVLAYATRLRARGQEKRAIRCVTEAWKNAPHPDFAAFVLMPERDGLSRAQAAKRLVASNPSHAESRILLAQVAVDAGLIGEARNQVERAEAEGVDQRRLYLIRAEVEEQERGDTEAGRIAQRAALRKAAVAPAGPVWVCTSCYTTHSAWNAKCDACDHIGTMQWLDRSRPAAAVPAIAG